MTVLHFGPGLSGPHPTPCFATRLATAYRSSQQLGAASSALLLASALGCSDTSARPVSLVQQAIIHGQDDRQDVYSVAETELRELALERTVVLVSPTQLRRGDGDLVELDTLSLGQRYGLCDGERFATQPALGICSGLLLDADLVLTAGHCVDEANSCERQLWAFDYAVPEPLAPVRLRAGNLYRCRSIALIGRAPVGTEGEAGAGSEQFDYAVVQLARPVSSERHAIAISTAAVTTGQALTVIGYPNGVPVKIDRGAVVLDAPDTAGPSFTLSSDTFSGSSGSGVFDSAGKAVGVLVQGGVDYIYQDAEQCFSTRRVVSESADEATPVSGELALRVHLATSALCDAGWPSESLCGRSSACGDGYCSADELSPSCQSDCPPIAPIALETLGSSQDTGCSVTQVGRTRRSMSTAAHAVIVYLLVLFAFTRFGR